MLSLLVRVLYIEYIYIGNGSLHQNRIWAIPSSDLGWSITPTRTHPIPFPPFNSLVCILYECFVSFLFVVLPFVYPLGTVRNSGNKSKTWRRQVLSRKQMAISQTAISRVHLYHHFFRLKCFASLYHFNGIFSFSLPAAAGSFSFLFCEKQKDGWWWLVRSISLSSALISLRQDIVDLPPSFSFFYIMRPSLLCVNLFYILLHVPSNNNKSNPIASATVYRTASFAVIRLVWRLVIMKEPEKFYSCSTLELSFKRRNLPTHFNSLNAALYISFHVFPSEQQKNVFFPFFL